MPLYFTQKEKAIIQQFVPKEGFWVYGSIHSKIQADNDRLAKIKTCSHHHTTYVGRKNCCSKCGSFFKPGMGFTWTALKHPDKVKQPLSNKVVGDQGESLSTPSPTERAKERPIGETRVKVDTSDILSAFVGSICPNPQLG